jgi:vacuolar-type H+-ATPase subunit I/STV1
MKNIFYFISLALLSFGLYLKYFYDVPDVQETVNFFTSWFFIIIGIASILINIFWSQSGNKKPKE